MLVLDRHNRSKKLLSIIKQARQDIDNWHLGYIKISHGSKNKIDSVTDKIQKHYGEHHGAIFKVEDHKVILIFEFGKVDNYGKLSKSVQAKVRNIGCRAVVRKLDEEILDSIETDFVLREGKLQQSLYEKRLKRIKNNILIIDDDDFSILALKELAQNYGTVTISKNPDDVESDYFKANPDIVLLDIEMPEKNGFEVLEEIYGLDPDACVLMVSAHSNEDNILNSCSVGSIGFMKKPVNEEVFIRYLKECNTMLNIF